jgi:hypothetical protein
MLRFRCCSPDEPSKGIFHDWTTGEGIPRTQPFYYSSVRLCADFLNKLFYENQRKSRQKKDYTPISHVRCLSSVWKELHKGGQHSSNKFYVNQIPNFHYNLKRAFLPPISIITKKHKLWMCRSKNKIVETNDIIMTKVFGKQVNHELGASGKGLYTTLRTSKNLFR